ncbi:MAG TPA: arsenic resistance N-acetyltransferase ArsN2 [Burkholderiales bacterium]|nr:arsenic resistance N-acetyltransferase ArsN2 [Burkholderiales bacterium]
MNAPAFRRALASDWPDISALLAASKLPLEGAQDHLGHFVVAHDGAGLVACGGLELYGPAALLRSLAVKPAHQGRRLGHEMVMRLVTLALNEEVGELGLLTEGAEPYFRRFGFKTVSREALPRALAASAEFRGACPASATAMLLDLRPH